MLVLYMVDGKPAGWGLARDFQSGIPEVGVVIAEKDYWGDWAGRGDGKAGASESQAARVQEGQGDGDEVQYKDCEFFGKKQLGEDL